MLYAKASAPAPTTPDRTTSLKRKREAMSPSKPANPWSKVKKNLVLPGVAGAGAATSGKDAAIFTPFGKLKSCEDIWNDDLVDQTVRIVMMQCQVEAVRNSKWNRSELYFYGLTKQSNWSKFELLDDAASRFLQFREAHFSEKPAAFLELSSVSHGRGKGGGDGSASMQFRVAAQCQFQEFLPCSVWSEVAPPITMDFQTLSGTAGGSRLFVYARVAEVFDVIPGANCNGRRLGALMDRFGNKRPLTIWDPVASTFPWATDKVLTILGARCDRNLKFGGQFVVNSDVCIMEHDPEELAAFSKTVKSRSWDFFSAPRVLGSPGHASYG